MGSALVEHRSALLVMCVASLLAGLPLAINMFWHLQVRKRVWTDVQEAYAKNCVLFRKRVYILNRTHITVAIWSLECVLAWEQDTAFCISLQARAHLTVDVKISLIP